MFGTLLNIVTIPLRAAVAPIKLAERAIDHRTDAPKDITDTLRYVVTAKEKKNDMDGFLDFDDE